MVLADPDFGCHRLGHIFLVAGQHDGAPYAGFSQGFHSLASVSFQLIGDQDMAGILSIQRNMDDRSDFVTIFCCNSKPFHKAEIPRGDLLTIYNGDHTLARILGHIRHTSEVERFAVGFLKAPADRMARMSFRQGSELNKLLIFHRAVMHTGHDKISLGYSSGLVKYDRLHL